MRLLLLIFLIPLSLFASKILSYNIYDRTDRADVMITFDTPYDGDIKQGTSSSKIALKLYDTEIESPKIKKISSNFLYKLTITPMNGYTQITADIPSGIILKASKTSDGYGLRLRFTAKSEPQKTQESSYTQPQKNTPTSLSGLPTKQEDLSQSYYIVIGILIAGIIALFYVKKSLVKKGLQKPKSNGWLFEATQDQQQEQTPKQASSPTLSNDASIRFQKKLSDQTSVVMLDFLNHSYLVLMGPNNILLDKFTDNAPVNLDEFEALLQTKQDELDGFLSGGYTNYNEPLRAYKEKASLGL